MQIDNFALDVNNYSAQVTFENVKRKGDFAHIKPGKMLSAQIIFIAVEAYIREGVLPEITIKNATDINDFLFSQKTNSNFEVKFKGETVQNINRYFISSSANAGVLERLNPQNGKKARLTTKSVMLANDLKNEDFIQFVEKNFYVDKANEVLNRLLTNERTKELKYSNSKIIKNLKAQGVFLVPKDYKISLKGFKTPTCPEELVHYEFSKHPTIAACTGKMFNLLAIDVDIPKALPATLMKLLKNSKTLNAIVPQSDKFKLFFKVTSTKLKDLNLLDAIGIEILYKRPANIVGAYDFCRNYQATGELQELPKELENILLSLQKTKIKPKTSHVFTTTESIRLNPDDIKTLIENLLDKKGIDYTTRSPKDGWEEETCNVDFPIVYSFSCPFEEEHGNRNKSKARLLVKNDGQVYADCHHKSCDTSFRIFQEEFNQVFTQYMRDNNIADKKETLAVKAHSDYLADIPIVKEARSIEIENLIPELMTLKFKELVFVKAPTGCGKTTTLLKFIAAVVKKGQKVAMLCSTKNEVERLIGELKRLGLGDMITPATKGMPELNNPQKFKLIVITTYAYLDYKSGTAETYAVCKHILSDRIVICDEVQILAALSEKLIPICSRYHNSNGALIRIKRCPKITKKGSCKDCHVLQKLSVTQEGNLEFFPKLLFSDCVSDIENPCDISEIFRPEFYPNTIAKHLKVRKIEPNAPFLKVYPQVSKRVTLLENTDIRILFPTIEQNGVTEHITCTDILKFENSEKLKIKAPIYTCGIPTIYGKSNIVIDNLLTYSDKIVLTSATVPQSVEKTINERAKLFGFKVKPTFEVQTVLMTFDMTLFKLDSELSLNDKLSLLKTFNVPTFFVEATLNKADIFYKNLKNNIGLAKRTEYFCEGDYIGHGNEKICRKSMFDGDRNIILTYANSAICKAVNMEDTVLLVVDCSQFLPTIALNLHNNPDIIQLEKQQTKSIEEKLYQIIGRALRSNLDYKQGMQQQDPRKILVILHNLPQELHGFKPFQNLLHRYQEFTDDEVLGLIPTEHLNCLLVNAKAALDGEIIVNKGKEQHQVAIKKAQEIGLKEFAIKFRRKGYDLLTPDDIKFLKKYKKNQMVDKNLNNKSLSTFKHSKNYTNTRLDNLGGENG